MRSGASLNVIKGVRPEAMDTARAAAERSGLSLGQWINSAIIGTAAESGIRPRANPVAPRADERPFDDQGFVAVNERLDNLAQQLDRLMARAETAGPPARPADAAEPHVAPSLRALESRLAAMARDLAPQNQATSQRLADAITRLNARLDQLIARPTPPDLDRRVAAVDRALAALNPEPATPAAPPADWSSGLDSAIAEIAARQRVLDGVTPAQPAGRPEGIEPVRAAAAGEQASSAADLSGLEKQLRHITEQIETLRRPCNVEGQMASLRGELADIGRMLTEALPRRILEGLQAEIRNLPERIDVGGDDAPELASVEQGLADIRDALQALAPAESVAGFDDEVKALSAKIDLLAGSGLDPEILLQIEQAIGELRSIAGRVASGEALAQLATDVRQIGNKLDRFIDSGRDRTGGMENLARRVDALAASLEGRAGDHSPALPPNFDALINTLADRLEAARPAGPDPVAFDRLQDQIVLLAQKLDASDGRLGHLGAIERTMTDLMGELKEARDGAIEAAQAAARAAAQEMLDRSAGPGAEVDVIKHEITELRATQAAIDRRTQDTLEAVHGTLERMVERLATIETDLQEARARPSSPDLPPAPRLSDPVQPGIAAPIARALSPTVQPRQAQSAPASPAEPRDPRSVMPDLPADHPLEPGSGAPHGRGGSAADRIAASEAALAAVKPQTTAEPGSKANFIAAARRAAQAAAADPSAGAQAGSEDKPYGTALGSIGETLAKSRRPLVIGIAAFLLVIGTLQLVTNMLGSGDRTAGEPQRPTASDTAVPSREPPAAQPPTRPGADAPREPVAPLPPPGRQPDVAPEKRSALPSAPPATAAAIEAPAARPGQPAASPSPFVASPSPFVMAPLGDVTGSVSKPQAAAPAARAPSTALAVATITPPAGADKIPVAIGGAALRTAAAAGNAAAAYEIGIRYAEGRGVAQNFDEAIRWLDAAAKGGLAPAQYRLGSLYEKGQGTRKDREAAHKLYVLAAEKGNGKAMHNLAVLYAEGLEGKPDYQMASQWFRKAADHGVSDSQYNLGILYARGIGVEQNLAESYKWFALAAAQGDADAGKKREDVSARLDPQSLVAARLAVQTWTADPQPDEAISVKVPPGGWDRPANPHPAKPKAAAPVQRKTGA